MKIKQVLPIGFVACLCMCMVFTSWGGRTAADAATVSCADIANLAFTDLQYNNPVIFTSAVVKGAVGTTPELCEVKGTIFPQINFIVTIPTTAYNQRFVMVGQGGAAGNINANASLTKEFYVKGFATAATDTGHVTTGQDYPWALPDKDPYADQKIIDYAYRSQHEVAVLTKKIIKAYRGADPLYSYYYGCSNAGREAMSEALRYPDDFDGYYAGSVDFNHAEDMIAFLYTYLINKETPIDSKLCLQAKYVYAKCDGIDGIVDGSIENPKACSFDPLVDLPACPGDKDAADCWTVAQRTAVKKLYDGLQTSWGLPIGPRYPFGSEVCSDPTNPSTSGWNRMATSFAPSLAGPQIKELFLRISRPWDWTAFNFDTDTFTVFATMAEEAMRVDSPNLWRVKNRGGKMIIALGLGGDHWPYITADKEYYYDQVVRYMGRENVEQFMRFYTMPGTGHCNAQNVGCLYTDWFTPLQNWVENGVPPGALIATRTQTPYLTARTRPICPYPEEARYKGNGSIDDAANFACIKPEVIAACNDIKKLSYTDIEFNKTVKITSTTIVAASATTPELCDVRGTIWPEINFALRMPTTTWNERFMMVGSSGNGGSIPLSSMPQYLQKGYATVGTDTGHVSTYPGDELWAVPENDYTNQKEKDFGYRSTHEVANLAKKIIHDYYGYNPKYSYIAGCSFGGRNGMINAQRYPEDFDGILAGCVSAYESIRQVGMIWLYPMWGPKVPASKICLQSKYVYDKCDSLDGLKDGVIENILDCEFDPMTDLPACPNDVDGPDCWTTDQRTAIKMVYQGPRTSSGKPITTSEGITIPGMPFGSEVCTNPTNPATTLWTSYTTSAVNLALNGIKYIVLRDPTWNPANFNFDTDPSILLSRPEESWQKSDNPNLSGMKALGHKIIHWESTASYSPVNFWGYYQSVLNYMGGEKAIKDFYKAYLVPGSGHCGGGVATSNVDWLTPLVNWVEKGIEPGAIIGTRVATPYLTARTRPLCPYPQVAKYLGTGSIDDAANFTCAEIIPSVVQIVPPRLNLGRTKTFSAIVRLPNGYRTKDWEIRAVVAQGAPAKEGTVTKGPNYFIAKFETADLTNLSPGEEPTITVSIIAERDEQQVAFEGRDIVKIIE
jgi:feruloyl esterase